jgi:signal transduction histidine kinase
MSWLNKISLKNKLIGLVLIVTISVIVIGYSVILVRFAKEQERKFQNTLLTTTSLLSDYCVGPMSFNDSVETQYVLERIKNLPELISASVYTDQQQLFAHFQDTATHKRGKNTVFDTIRKEIKYKNIDYGWLQLVASRQNITDEINQFALSNGGWLLFLLLLGAIAAYRMQFVITRPLAKLTEVSRKISIEADYSIRLERDGNDEIAYVYRAFNQMLQQIQKRDEARDEIQKNLKKAKERAERADQLKTSFLTNMSHEIRTPMNAILGFTNLLIEENLPKSQQDEYLKVINESGNSLLNLVNDILDISKIEAGEMAIAEGSCNLNDLFKELQISFNEIKSQKEISNVDIEISNPLFAKDLSIITDPYRLRQVFVNLIGNALKFTEEGTVTFGILDDGNSEFIKFFVKDTGIGIEKELQNEIFKRFHKVDSRKTRLYRGAGLGLAISKDIVKMLGGEICVESEPDVGSTFYFTLPMRVESNENTEKKNTESPNDKYKLDLSGKTILVAEDEPNNFMYLNQILQRFNATIIWARDGEEAVNQVKKQHLDLILMDIKMPNKDGYEAAREIKTSFPDSIIIAQTAYVSNNEVDKCKEAGCDYYVSKPINRKMLANTIKKAMNL